MCTQEEKCKTKYKQVQAELESTQRDLKNVTAELLKVKHLYEKVVEQKEALARENKKLQGKTCPTKPQNVYWCR